MMNSRDWLEKARKEKFAIGAFNVGNLEAMKAIALAAANKKSPVIIESSPGETSWMGADNIVDLAHNFSADYGIPILVNLDHATTYEDCMIGIEQGYDMIHVDGSKLSYEENVALTKSVVEMVRAKGLIAEGELDHIGGTSEVHGGAASKEAGKISMSDPERVSEFVKATGIDIFAAFIGNVHGLYLESPKILDIDRLRQIARNTNAYLSLHGSSGIPEDQIKLAIAEGIVKINLNTEIRQVFKNTFEKVLGRNPEEYAMYKIEQPVLDEIQKLVERKIQAFGSANCV